PDLMDIDVVVKERNTGTIQLGAGYSTFSKFILNGQINQTNLFGRGQRLGLSIDFSNKASVFDLNFTEPYFWDTEWSLGGDLYVRRRKLTEYDEDKKGVGVHLGHPLADNLDGSIGYKIDDTTLKGNETSDDIFDLKTASGITSSVTLGLNYDSRD